METATFNPTADETSDGLNLRARTGTPVTVVRWITEPDDTHDAEVLPMATVRFEDGVEVDAWPDELTTP